MVHVIGIDGGGTGSRAAIADAEGRVLGSGTGGPANIMTDMRQAKDSILEAARRACLAASLNPAAMREMPAFLGLAGVGGGDRAKEIAAALPFRRAIVESDAYIALHGALGDHDGAVAIIGTGSVFVARSGGTMRRIGGWGFKIGDLGSGARMGRALLQEVLLVHDRVRPHSALTDEVLSRFGREPFALVEYAHAAKPADFGAFAPIVFDHAQKGDPLATALVEGALRSVEEALDAIVWPGCDRLCLLGGLGPFYAERLSGHFRHMLRQPLGDALQGAVDLARRHFQPQALAAASSAGE
jgi:glucosamine kinase